MTQEPREKDQDASAALANTLAELLDKVCVWKLQEILPGFFEPRPLPRELRESHKCEGCAAERCRGLS